MGAADEEKSPETTAGVVTRLQQAQAIKSRRPAAVIASNASKELEALAAHMTDIPDARKLALRMYYLELSEGVLLKDACPNESREEVFFITPMRCWQSQLLIGFFDWGFFLHQRLPYYIGGDCFLLRSGRPLVEACSSWF